jgi:hypothetical protein
LHDQFGRHLTTIKMDLRSIERELAGEMTSETVRVLRENAQTIGQTVDETVQTVRAIATQLRPAFSTIWGWQPPSNGSRRIFRNVQAFRVLLPCKGKTHMSAATRRQRSSAFSRKS